MARYRELIVKADDRDLIPYLAGYLAAENVSGVYFAEESGLHVSALKERFRHHGEVQHIVCTDEAAVALRDALAKAVPRYRFEIKEERELERARFRFEVATPNRNVAQLVRETLAGVPPQTFISGFEPRERIKERAQRIRVRRGRKDGDVGRDRREHLVAAHQNVALGVVQAQVSAAVTCCLYHLPRGAAGHAGLAVDGRMRERRDPAVPGTVVAWRLARDLGLKTVGAQELPQSQVDVGRLHPQECRGRLVRRLRHPDSGAVPLGDPPRESHVIGMIVRDEYSTQSTGRERLLLERLPRDAAFFRRQPGIDHGARVAVLEQP